MKLRVVQSPWRLMLVVNVAVLAGVFLYKIKLPPYVPYIHLLADYHFGFAKRALIGAPSWLSGVLPSMRRPPKFRGINS